MARRHSLRQYQSRRPPSAAFALCGAAVPSLPDASARAALAQVDRLARDAGDLPPAICLFSIPVMTSDIASLARDH